MVLAWRAHATGVSRGSMTAPRGQHIREQVLAQQHLPNPLTINLPDGTTTRVWLATGKDGKKIIGDALWWGVNCAGKAETPIEVVKSPETAAPDDHQPGPTPGALQGDDYPLTYDADGYPNCPPVWIADPSPSESCSTSQSGRGMSGKKWRNSRSRFVQLHHRLLNSHAWHMLTPLQRAAYIEIAQLYDGKNNGRIAVSARRLAGLIPCSKNADLLRTLEDAGFIDTIKVGKYTKKEEERLASEYRLTDFKCDVTHEAPSRRYNPQHRWDASMQKPKRKALTDAERMRRHRKKKRYERYDDRPSQLDATVQTSGTLNVTPIKPRLDRARKSAKNDGQESPSVTLTVPASGTLIHLASGTLIHLTRGRRLDRGTNRENIGSKPIVARGHSTCPIPKSASLPPGCHYCRFEKCDYPHWYRISVVDHELVGTDEGREALAVLRAWNGEQDFRRLLA